MKTSLKLTLKIELRTKILYLTILTLLSYSCKKDNNPNIDFVFATKEIIYYPDKHISITFEIKPKYDIGTYGINWYHPDTLLGAGPTNINVKSNVNLDFEIFDNKNTVKRFQYEIKADTIDSIRYDYRNKYIGTYYCKVTSTFNGSTEYYQDTLTVTKGNSFKMLNILTRYDIKNNYEGNKMTYLDTNGNNSYPTVNFYGYHSGLSFSHDSIHYSASGPLGFYYTNNYRGIKINH